MTQKLADKRIALVFDWLDDRGGMELVNLALADLFPQAVIFTSVFDENKFPQLSGRVKTSWLQRFPAKIRPKHQLLGPLMPSAFHAFDLSNFDIIISSASSGYSKCVRKTRPEQVHICYCHTPIRYLYHAREEYSHNYPFPNWLRPFKVLMPMVLDYLTRADQKSIKSVDHFVANSQFIATRIAQYYDQKALVIYPGIKKKKIVQVTKKFANFLAIGRFIPYKRFDLLVETFAQNGLPLKLAGVGPELERCKKLAAKLGATNIEFLGFVSDQKLADLYANARAFLFPAEEDFGLTPVEAMAAGLPVIYLDKGGARESVGPVGVAFSAQTVTRLQAAIDNFLATESKFSAEKIQARAAEFTEEKFQQKMLAFVEAHC